MSEETTATTFPVGARVLVAADADDVWFDGDEAVEGVVVPADHAPQASYVAEGRVNVLEYDGTLTQYVRPEDLTLITLED